MWLAVRDLDRVSAFVASLSGVDGATVLDDTLTVLGFGWEIKAKADPTDTILEFDSSESSGEERTLDGVGMRHRSAAYLCQNVPNLVAYVISQDGDISVIFQNDGRVERHVVGRLQAWTSWME